MNYNEIQDTKRKHYIPFNVYEMAKKRIKEAIQITDEQYVCFSGGKDSLTVLNLVEECYKELGIDKKVKVCFFDEEVIPLEVVDFVKKIYDTGKYDFRWYCVTLESQKYVLGNTVKYIQWDKNREWVREKPKWAIDIEVENTDETTMDGILAKGLKGRICSFKGIRAEESLIRLTSILSRPNKPHFTGSKIKRVIGCTPIYDWMTRDIFLYFYKNNIEYCKNYDRQMWNNQELRVATPLLPEGKEQFPKIATTFNPEYYERILEVFPDMALQNRYFKEYQVNLHSNKTFDKYSHDEEGLFKFIHDSIDNEYYRKEAIKEATQCLNKRKKEINKEEFELFGGYPLYRIFLGIASGAYRRHIMHYNEYTKQDYIFEGYTSEEYEYYNNNRKRLRQKKYRRMVK